MKNKYEIYKAACKATYDEFGNTDITVNSLNFALYEAIRITQEECAERVCFWCRHEDRLPTYDSDTGDWVHYLADKSYAVCDAGEIFSSMEVK